MSAFVEARHQLANDLEEAGFDTSAFVPENVVPPLVFIRPVRNPVQTSTEGMDGLTYTYRVGLVLVADVNPDGEEAIDAIEAMLENVIYNTDGWDVEEVDTPVVWNSPGSGRFPAIGLVLSKTITIKGGE